MVKKKYYVVLEGRCPGIYDNWMECKKQVNGFSGAKYKSFEQKSLAEEAFNKGLFEKKLILPVKYENRDINTDSLAVDAACSGNPGAMEYRGIYIRTGEEIFRQGPFPGGTNNIGEFLAIVHALAYLKEEDMLIPVYTDSKTAISWLRKKKVNTALERTVNNHKIFELINRACKWLDKNRYSNKIIKWDTKVLGEIPADFGRK
ncbi:MAG: ribonuclease H [bacterium]|nr:ribonuclease H [bacterium]